MWTSEGCFVIARKSAFVMGKWSPGERAEFAGASQPDSRRDILARITHSGHK